MMKPKKKRIIFDDTDVRHAKLKIQLDYDELSQAEFFRAILTGYVDRDESVVSFINRYKQSKGTQSKTRLKKIHLEEKAASELTKQFGIKKDEIEDIFDILEEQHPDL